MIKGLGLFSFLFATIIGYTQPGAKADSCSLLWSISGNGLRDTSYLFGTMHSSDDRLRRWDDNWQKAFESCGIIAGETDLAHGSLDMLSMLQTLMIDTTIEKVLPPSKVETIRNYIAQRLGPEMASVMMKMQPFFLMVLLMELPEDLTEVGEVMDIYLQGLASQKGKQVVGLETSAEQLEVIKGVPILYQAEMLYEFVSLSSKGLHLDVMALSDSLIIQTYLNQCLNDFVVLSKEIEFDEQLMDQLLPRRNLRFVNRLGPLMTQMSVFCAVGALHLPGNDGMIALLRSQGFKVFPVRFEFLEK